MRNHTLFAIVLLLLAAPTSAALAAPKGLWLMPRKDACNTSRADVAGRMKTAPEVVWSYGVPANTIAYVKPVKQDGKALYFTRVRAGLRLTRQDGSNVWSRPTMGVTTVVGVLEFGGKAGPAAVVLLGSERLSMVDVATGKTLWTWSVPPGAYLGGYRLLDRGGTARLIVFPQNSMQGLCFAMSASHRAPVLLWRKDYTGRYWQNFGPFFVMADMDNDGRDDIVLVGKPGYAGVIDGTTGNVKFDIKYNISGKEEAGRPYGLIHATDIDGDGFRDLVVVSCQVEHYVSVLKNNGGKSLSVAWSQFVAMDLITEDTELRPNVTSLADVNGDGSKELVLGLYNSDGDKRWHTIVFDTMKGFRARIADLPDRYFWGCYDMDGDGRPEIITSPLKQRNFSMPTELQATDGKTLQMVASVPDAAFVFMHNKPSEDTGFHATRSTPAYLSQPGGAGGPLISRGGTEMIWRLKGAESVFEPFHASPTSRLVLFSEATGDIAKLDLAMRNIPAKQGPCVNGPLVSVSGGQRELILARSDETIIGGVPDLSKPGKFRSSWTVPGAMPSTWIGPDGKRLVCAVDPKDDVVSLYSPRADAGGQPLARFRTPQQIRRSEAGLLPYGRDMRLLVGMHTGAHNTSCAVYDAGGQVVWSDPQEGPYPRAAAAADLNADGRDELFIDNHGKHMIYDSSGKSRLVAHGWNDTVPGRSDGAKYALPIVGPFGPKGETRIVLSPGLDCLETLDGSGARLAKVNYPSTYDFDQSVSAVARLRTDGWDCGMVNKAGIFHCADVESCRTRWTVDLGCEATTSVSISSGDVDDDGRDNFLVSLPNGQLLALDERDGKGTVLWRKQFEAAVVHAYLADVDGDGIGEIVVSLDDGRVQILR